MEDEATISGDNCVEALLRAGFRIRSRSNGIAILVRGSNIVMVPDLDVLEPALLRAIVRSSGLPREELDRHLAHHPKRSGFFPRPVTSNGVTGHGTDPRTTTSTGVLVPRERAASKTSKDG